MSETGVYCNYYSFNTLRSSDILNCKFRSGTFLKQINLYKRDTRNVTLVWNKTKI